MDTSELELLLTQLISVNEQILDELRDVKFDISEIKDELSWIKPNSFADRVCEKLSDIEMGISGIETNTSGL